MPAKSLKFFYKGNKLSTLSTDDDHHVIVSASNKNLFETSSQTSQTRLLAIDVQNSTVAARLENVITIAYSPFGNGSYPPAATLLSRFAGQHWLPSAFGYLLGNGHRLFIPLLMRLYSPDSLSPFGIGGINAYAYCGNDPINRVDPSGKFFRSLFKQINGGYSYEKLAPRLENRNPALSINEYIALGKSVDKRLAKLNRSPVPAISNGVTSNTAATGKILKKQRKALNNLALDESKRYNPDITKELFGEIPAHGGATGNLARQLLAPPTEQSVINEIPEALFLEDLQERLRRLRFD